MKFDGYSYQDGKDFTVVINDSCKTDLSIRFNTSLFSTVYSFDITDGDREVMTFDQTDVETDLTHCPVFSFTVANSSDINTPVDPMF